MMNTNVYSFKFKGFDLFQSHPHITLVPIEQCHVSVTQVAIPSQFPSFFCLQNSLKNIYELTFGT